MTVGPHKIESSTGPTSDDASFSRAPGGPASELAMRVWASARDAESSGTARESELCATERIKKSRESSVLLSAFENTAEKTGRAERRAVNKRRTAASRYATPATHDPHQCHAPREPSPPAISDLLLLHRIADSQVE